MNDFALKPSELKSLFRYNAIGNYKWKGFVRSGNFPKLLLESGINDQVVVGKIVPKPTDGELKLWPKLQHRNLNPLLENLRINDKVSVMISPAVGKSISILIHEDNFSQHPLCFDRKKSYAKNILSGLNYMHQNKIFLLNLSDENVEICSYTDRAIICDFSFLVSRKEVTKKMLPSDSHYKPPEVEAANESDTFDSSSIDVWDYGILLLQVFTQHLIPWSGAVNDSLELMDIGVLKKANSGSYLEKKMANELKSFLQELLSQNPDLRPSTEEAFQSNFLQSVYSRQAQRARFRQADETSSRPKENIFHENAGRNSISSSSLSDDDGAWKISKSNAIPRQIIKKHSKTDKAQLLRTKSEPYGTVFRENPYESLPTHTSYPVLFKDSNSEHSLISSEESIPEHFYPLFETTPLRENQQNNIDCDVNQINVGETADAIGKPYDLRPFDIITDWDEDIFQKLDEDSLSFNHPNQQANMEDDLASKSSFINCLEYIMSQMSASGLSLDHDAPADSNCQKTHQRKSRKIRRAGEPNINKIRTNDDDNDFRNRSELKSPPLLLIKNPNYEMAETLTEICGNEIAETPTEICVNEIATPSKHFKSIDLSDLNDERDPRTKTEMVVDGKTEVEESISPARKKWYHKLCMGCRKKKAKTE